MDELMVLLRDKNLSFKEIGKIINNYSSEVICLKTFALFLKENGKAFVEDCSLQQLMVEFDNLEKKGVERDAEFFRSAIEDIKKNWERYRFVYEELLEDEASRKLYVTHILSRITIDPIRLNTFTATYTTQYFDKTFFTFDDGDIYVDCGAYNGDTALEYILTCPGYGHIYAYEPFPNAMEEAKERLKHFAEDGSIDFVQKSVSDCENERYLKINTGAGNSQVAQEGELQISCCSLDQSINDRVDYLKMDIEGMEVEALRGAEKTIQKNKCQLAICVYHKPQDLWQIPIMIYRMESNYKFCLRHFGGPHYYDTILYCTNVCRKRREEIGDEKLKQRRIENLLQFCQVRNKDQGNYSLQREEYVCWMIGNQNKLNGELNIQQQLNARTTKQNEELSQDIQKAQEKIAKLTEELEEERQKSNDANNRIATMNKTIAEYETKYRNTKQKIDELSVELSFSQDRNNMMSETIDILDINIQGMDAMERNHLARMEELISQIKGTASYRVSSVMRKTMAVLRTKSAKTYLRYANACFWRLLGTRKYMDRFANPMDHADQVVCLTKHHCDQACWTHQNQNITYRLEQMRVEKLLNMIHKHKNAGHRVIAIMAPIFTEENIKDGYYRRIKTVDDMMDETTLRIYMSPFHASIDVHMQYIDQYHVHVSYFRDIKRHTDYILQIGKECDLIYHHSVGYTHEGLTRDRHIKKIFDLHGALPEELTMYGNHKQAQIENGNERLAVEYAYALVSVTKAMAEHFKKKYPTATPRFIFMPILDDMVISGDSAQKSRKYINGKPVVVYAGGMQKWQMIPEMQKAMCETKNDCVFRVFTPHPQEFWDIWGDRKCIADVSVSSRSPQDLMKEYEACHYGFLLRKDITVNHVACPTKVVEYISKGIVPIINTEHVGDFVSDGMQYISLEDFLSKPLPDEETRIKMVRANLLVFDKLIERFEHGRNELQKIFRGGE